MRTNIFACALFAAAAQAESIQKKWNIVTEESLNTKSIAAQLHDYVLEQAGPIPDDGTGEAVRVAKAQYESEFEYNYPGLITMGSGSKYDVGAYFETSYGEDDGGAVSEFKFKPSIAAYQDMWNATIIMDMYQWLFYTQISLFKI